MEFGSKLADYLRQGADTLTNLPIEAQRFLTNPQAFTQLVTGKNPLPKETGFVAGATGLPAKNPVQGGVLNPASAPYQEGYEQGEPVAIASMALPAYATALRAGAPKAYNALENYMVKSGGMIPLEAYHGTNTKFNKFDDVLANTRDEGWLGKGHYFSTDPNVARANKYVANVDLEANKPYELSMPNFSTDKRELIRSALNLEKTASAKDVTNKLKELGHDSVVLDYSPTGYNNKEVLVFGGQQANIKNWSDVPKTSFNKILLEEQIDKIE